MVHTRKYRPRPANNALADALLIVAFAGLVWLTGRAASYTFSLAVEKNTVHGRQSLAARVPVFRGEPLLD